MTREEAIRAWEQMRSEIDKENWLFVGTINPQMVDMALEALKREDTMLKEIERVVLYGERGEENE